MQLNRMNDQEKAQAANVAITGALHSAKQLGAMQVIFQRVIRVLSAKYGVKIDWADDDAHRAFTDGKDVYIYAPGILEFGRDYANALNYRSGGGRGKQRRKDRRISVATGILRMFRGLVYHEMGHVLFTPSDGIINIFNNSIQGETRPLFLMLEETRMERVLISRYPQMRYDIRHVHNGELLVGAAKDVVTTLTSIGARQAKFSANDVYQVTMKDLLGMYLLYGFRQTFPDALREEIRRLFVVCAKQGSRNAAKPYNDLIVDELDGLLDRWFKTRRLTGGMVQIQMYRRIIEILQVMGAGTQQPPCGEMGKSGDDVDPDSVGSGEPKEEKGSKGKSKSKSNSNDDESDDDGDSGDGGEGDEGDDDADDADGSGGGSEGDDEDDDSEADGDGDGSGDDADEDGDSNGSGADGEDGDDDGEGSGKGDDADGESEGDSGKDGDLGDDDDSGKDDNEGDSHKGAGKGDRANRQQLEKSINQSIADADDGTTEIDANDMRSVQDMMQHNKAMLPPTQAFPSVNREVPQEARQSANGCMKALRPLRAMVDSGWDREERIGRANILSVIKTRGKSLDVFDQWNEGLQDATSIEVVVGFDLSSSMGMYGADVVSRDAWVIKSVCDQIGARCTSMTYANGFGYAYRPLEKITKQTYRKFGSGGGTDPSPVVINAGSILMNSKASHRLFVILTDGEWFGFDAEAVKARDAMKRSGITTVAVMYPPAKLNDFRSTQPVGSWSMEVVVSVNDDTPMTKVFKHFAQTAYTRVLKGGAR